ncbi:MAG: 30S ribosomal protein S12 methylthiotransferase RimO [Planctomycetota bacterium]|jgi:ribosomal protein S12 methylthiotransferase
MARKKAKITTVGFYALGCPKNMVDSEKMLAKIAQAGFLITSDNENADVVVINTCGFIAPAKTEALEIINHAVDRKRRRKVKKVIVAGCLPQRLGESLTKEFEGVDAIVSLAERDDIGRIIKRSLHSSEPSLYISEPPDFIHDDRERLLITPGHWAYLRISEGCNYRCSFCTIPFIRGKFRSKPLELVVSEAEELVSSGVEELNIIAQATTSYGQDLGIKDGLAVLLEKLGKIEKLGWIRLMYLYPAGITEHLIKTISESDKIVNYIDVPIQHINDRILKDMHRPDTSQRIRGLIKRLKTEINDVVLRTTLIVGFPGETDEEFNELLEFVEWARFDALGCFPYYPEADTTAAQMGQQVPEAVKEERYKKVMLKQQQIVFDKNKQRIGTELLCLVDSVEQQGTGRGRFYGQAPEIDSACLINKCSAGLGELIKVKVVKFKGYDLVVEQV